MTVHALDELSKSMPPVAVELPRATSIAGPEAKARAWRGARDLPHLGSALLALLLLTAWALGGVAYAHQLEAHYIHALASHHLHQVAQGRALQVEALRQPDLLLLYGASEISASFGPYHPSELFQTEPTGFTVLTVGLGATTPLIMLQSLAAVGPDLRGKKLAILTSLTWFISDDANDHGYYAGRFSLLQANELAFSTELSFPLKRETARRMLEFPETLRDAPVLRFGLEQLADGSPASHVLYYMALPLGKLQSLALRLQDHWQSVALLDTMRRELDAARPPRVARLDWSSLLARAEQEARANADSNPFGYDNLKWSVRSRDTRDLVDTLTGGQFVPIVQQAPGWADVDLLLRAVRELGAEPLIINAPIKGVYYDVRGVSRAEREGYYQKLRTALQPYGVRAADFADHDGDPYFVVDQGSHPSAKAWVYYSRVLDAFYHEAPTIRRAKT